MFIVCIVCGKIYFYIYFIMHLMWYLSWSWSFVNKLLWLFSLSLYTFCKHVYMKYLFRIAHTIYNLEYQQVLFNVCDKICLIYTMQTLTKQWKSLVIFSFALQNFSRFFVWILSYFLMKLLKHWWMDFYWVTLQWNFEFANNFNSWSFVKYYSRFSKVWNINIWILFNSYR